MKIIVLLFTCVWYCCTLQAQRSQLLPLTIIPNPGLSPRYDKAIDTVYLPPVTLSCFQNTGVALLALGGNVASGTNGFADQEKAQFYHYAGGGQITGVLVFCEKRINTGNTDFTVRLYDKGTPAHPGALLATSQPVSYAALDTTDNGALFTFNPPQVVADSFFASVTVHDGSPNPDSIYVYTLFNIGNPTFPCGDNTAWEKQADDNWYLMSGTASNEWGIDVQFLMLPIIDNGNVSTGKIAPLVAHRVFPNPAAELINISYSLHTSSDVAITVTDPAGRQLFQQVWNAQYPGAYNQLLDISEYPAGLYTYTLQAGTYWVSGKVLVR